MPLGIQARAMRSILIRDGEENLITKIITILFLVTIVCLAVLKW